MTNTNTDSAKVENLREQIAVRDQALALAQTIETQLRAELAEERELSRIYRTERDAANAEAKEALAQGGITRAELAVGRAIQAVIEAVRAQGDPD